MWFTFPVRNTVAFIDTNCSMLRVQNRVQIGLEVLQFFTMHAWDFKSDKFAQIWNELNEKDKQMYV